MYLELFIEQVGHLFLLLLDMVSQMVFLLSLESLSGVNSSYLNIDFQRFSLRYALLIVGKAISFDFIWLLANV